MIRLDLFILALCIALGGMLYDITSDVLWNGKDLVHHILKSDFLFKHSAIFFIVLILSHLVFRKKPLPEK